MGKVDLSIVIPTYNCARWLPFQLEGIAAGLSGTVSAEVLVVDNRSTDGSAAVASECSEKHGLPLRILEAFEQQGEPYARNVGLRAARSERIAFCDADDVVGDSWVSAMAEGLGAADYVTGPVDIYRLNEEWLARMRGTSVFESMPTVDGNVPFAHGCNVGFRRSVLESLGGFDENQLIGCDVEIGIRAWRSGVTLHWAPTALVHYRLRRPLRENFRQARAYARVRPRFRRMIGVPPGESSSWTARTRRMAWLARHLPSLGSKKGRARWIWVLGEVVGELQASNLK